MRSWQGRQRAGVGWIWAWSGLWTEQVAGDSSDAERVGVLDVEGDACPSACATLYQTQDSVQCTHVQPNSQPEPRAARRQSSARESLSPRIPKSRILASLARPSRSASAPARIELFSRDAR